MKINWFKREIKDPDEVERRARRFAKDLSDLLEKYDERTEEIIGLLKEKSSGLWDSKKYYEMALAMKEENREIKQDKNEKQQEVNTLKRQWGDLGEILLKNNILIKPQHFETVEYFIFYLQCIQYTDKDLLPLRNIIAAMKRLNISKDDMESKYNTLYTNLRMKDWEI